MSGTRRQEGVALVTALLVVALATIATVAMTTRQHLDIRRTGNLLEHDQAYWHAASGEALAAQALRLIAENPGAIPWDECRTPPVSVELDGMAVQLVAEDLHCRLNVNNLADSDDEESRDTFLRLVEDVAAGQGLGGVDPDGILHAVRDWMDPEVDDPWYAGLQPPYRSPGAMLSSASELALVRGIDPDLFQALRPYITAVPARGVSINYQQTPEQLLEAADESREHDPEEEALEAPTWVRLHIAVDSPDRRYRQCSVANANTGEIVIRQLRGC